MNHDWPFFPYERIVESLAAWLGDDEPAFRALRGVEWLASEKIHGANCCFVSDGARLCTAKRKAYLAPDEDFFGHATLLTTLGPKILGLARAVRARDARTALVFVYGELFGGGYPHPEVAPVAGVEPVQTGCWYCPHIAFAVFDIGVVRSADEARTYLDHDAVVAACAAAELLAARPIARGSYEDMMRLPLGFATTYPARFSLPELAHNPAEGVVVKPTAMVAVPRREQRIRPVIKRKIATFAEDARFHAAEKWAARVPMTGASALEHLRYELSALVVEPRLAAAVSKVGRVEPGDVARAREVLRLLLEDFATELRARQHAELAGLSPEDAHALEQHALDEARALIQLHLGVVLP